MKNFLNEFESNDLNDEFRNYINSHIIFSFCKHCKMKFIEHERRKSL